MLQAIPHRDVTRLRCSTRASRAMNYEVSAYAVRGVLIDTAFPAVGDDFAAWVAEARPEGALVTHHHEDHSGNVGRLVAQGWDARAIQTEVLGARDLTGILSRGDHAKRNIVESVLAGIVPPDGASGPTPGPSKQ